MQYSQLNISPSQYVVISNFIKLVLLSEFQIYFAFTIIIHFVPLAQAFQNIYDMKFKTKARKLKNKILYL